MRVLGLAVVAACGRIGFDAGTSGPPGTDAGADAADGGGPSIPAGAKVWLRMDSGPQGGIVDSAGNHVVSCAGTCPSPKPGIHGGGYVFGDEEVQVASRADLDASGGYTAAIWLFLAQNPAAEGCAFSRPFDNANQYDTFTMCVQTDGTLIFDSENAAGTPDTQNAGTLSLNTWHHLVEMWDGTTKSGWIDGVMVTSNNVGIGMGNLPISVGAENGGFSLPGVYDDAIYYTRALTAAEIAQLATP